jgi:hypothetical protein
MKHSVAALIIVAALGVCAEAQAPVPPRDRSGPPPSGTGRIRGRVVAADTGAPLRRALVYLGSSRNNRTISTDADGRFDVANLPDGSYFLTVARNGYASMQFGQRRPFEPGRTLEIANGQLIDRVDFALPRGGVITGRVTDPLGEPVTAVSVEVMRYRYMPGGKRQLVPVNRRGMFGAVTDDLGEFRVSGLMPGTYVLSANPNGLVGRGIVSGAGPGTQMSGDSLGYATTYYPGTIGPEQAEPISVGVGDVANASFTLSTERLARVSGTVRDSQGRPATGANVGLHSRTPTGFWGMGGSQIGPDGQFSIANVPPGDYSIDVVPRSSRIRPAGSNEFDEIASIPFTANGQDVTDLVITTTPGAIVSGRVIFEGTSKAAKPDLVSAHSPENGSDLVYRSETGAIDAAGRFELRGIMGRALFVTGFKDYTVRDAGWSMKAVTLNGADISDTPIDIPNAGEISGIEITLTNTSTRLSGTVTNANREAVKDYVVVILPEHLKEGVMPGRFTRTVGPNQEGRYEIRGLPAADYLVVAVAAHESGNEWDPAFRKLVEPNAKRFRLTHGQTATLDLELMP